MFIYFLSLTILLLIKGRVLQFLSRFMEICLDERNSNKLASGTVGATQLRKMT